MQYPLDLSFKIATLVPQIYVRDALGQPVLYVRQKLMKLKEEVTVFTDSSQGSPLYHIKADRVIDWSARYTFSSIGGDELGSVKRHGARSIWKAHYDIFHGDSHKMTIREENALIKVADSIMGQIPLLGLFSGYVFHPAYSVISNQDDSVLLRMKKRSSFFESKFSIEKVGNLDKRDENVALLSLLMMVLLERRRG